MYILLCILGGIEVSKTGAEPDHTNIQIDSETHDVKEVKQVPVAAHAQNDMASLQHVSKLN